MPEETPPPNEGPERFEPDSRLQRRQPTWWQSTLILAGVDFASLWHSWLCRGFFLVSAVVTVITLKGMQAEEATASLMLEVVYTTYLIVWMHAVIFIAGGALIREQDCLTEAILSRGVTRGEYIGSKLIARSAAILVMIVGVLVPASTWAIRQDQLVRTELGYIATPSRDTEVEAWDPSVLYAGADGTIVDPPAELSDEVLVGDVLAQLDDTELFAALETERRAEEDARSNVEDARRQHVESVRAVSEAEDGLGRAERGLLAASLLSAVERADREADFRARERELQNARDGVVQAQNDIATAEHALEEVGARVRETRTRLGHSTMTSPISGVVIEALVQEGQRVGRGEHLFTVAPLHEYQLTVPIFDLKEFQRLEEGLAAYVTIQGTEFTGTVDRLGATTQEGRYGVRSNLVIVRFRSEEAQGLLGRNADVRIVLPPREDETSTARALLNTITGRGEDDAETRTASVTHEWMAITLLKLIGCACLLISMSLLAAVLTRNALVGILSVTGIWHISNLLFDFAGLPQLSYLEISRTMDKVLAGVANMGDELVAIGWLFGIAAVLGGLAVVAFISRDPVR